MVDKKKTGCPCHDQELKSLNRVSGQVEGVKKMIAEGCYCPNIIIQIKAIRSALKTVQSNMLKSHLNSCVVESFNSKNEKDKQDKIDELTNLFKKLS